jgi:four helix bundle protein
MSDYKGFKDLIVFQKSYSLAMEIFEITKTFPKEERYSLVDQARRSSIQTRPCKHRGAWVKRKYPESFVNKLLEALAEEAETEVWIDTSEDCKYIGKDLHNSLLQRYGGVAKMLNSMISNPEKFCH